jgi:hypothetical protein
MLVQTIFYFYFFEERLKEGQGAPAIHFKGEI